MSASTTLVVVGGSAGSLTALGALLAGLPSGFPAAILAALHAPPSREAALRIVLRGAGALPIAFAEDGESLAPGRVVVSPPNRHLFVEPGRLRLGQGPKEHGFRPAIDPLFRSAARHYGPEVTAVVLSGGNADGTAGLLNVVLRGGLVIAQDPREAQHPAMPESALRNVPGVCCLPLAEIAALLARRVGDRTPARAIDAGGALDRRVPAGQG